MIITTWLTSALCRESLCRQLIFSEKHWISILIWWYRNQHHIILLAFIMFMIWWQFKVILKDFIVQISNILIKILNMTKISKYFTFLLIFFFSFNKYPVSTCCVAYTFLIIGDSTKTKRRESPWIQKVCCLE